MKIFCLPLSGLGHINACIGVCTAMQRRGHSIVFGVEKSWKGKLREKGFEEEVFEEHETKHEEASGAQHSNFMKQMSTMLRKSFKEHLVVTRLGFLHVLECMKYSDQQLEAIIEKVKPDIIILDHYMSYPSLVKSNIPIVLMHSANPLVTLTNESLPPSGFGLPLNDQTDWEACRKLRHETFQVIHDNLNEWLVEQGLPSLPDRALQYESPLHIILYPKALFDGYAKLVNLSDNWVLLEHTLNSHCSIGDFNLPPEFCGKPGKIVYVSMGSMGSSDVDLMVRLTKLLSKSKHKFIITRGLSHKEYELYDNQWGEPFLNQLQILQICDLFITHGGNNSITEALYFGKPMIVCPLLGDQYNNAQRISELNLGVRLNPFTVEESELLSSIERTLCDTELHKRLNELSTQLQKSSSMDSVVKRIELVAGNKV